MGMRSGGRRDGRREKGEGLGTAISAKPTVALCSDLCREPMRYDQADFIAGFPKLVIVTLEAGRDNSQAESRRSPLTFDAIYFWS